MDYSLFDFLKLLGSLGFFLYGMKLMSESLQKVAGDRLRSVLSAMTSNRIKGVFTGFLITAIIQSSSATTVMLVSFVNAGLVTLGESLGVIMGANIGTTVTAWLISILGFKVKISVLVLPLIGISLPLLFSKNTNRSNWGNVIIGFAILFIGLDFLKQSTPDIHSNPEILSYLTRFSDFGYGSIIIFLLIGTGLTLVIQSSSAVMALTLVMCFNGWINFEMAAAMVLGENIGTTITANLAALVANTSAKRTALGHMFFNVIGVLLLFPFFYPFLRLIGSISMLNGFDSPFVVAGQTAQQSAEAIPVALSIFHTTFNVLMTSTLIWFVKPLEKTIIKLIKQKESDEEFKLQYINTGLLSTVEMSVFQARKELIVYTERVEKMFDETKLLLQTNSKKKITNLQAKIAKSEEFSDQLEIEIAAYLTDVSKQDLSHKAADNIHKMLQTASNIESVADSCYSISNAIGRKVNGKIEFKDNMQENLIKFSEQISSLFEITIETVRDRRFRTNRGEIKKMIIEIRNHHLKLKEEHFKSLRKGEYKTKVGVIYADIYNELLKMAEITYDIVSLFVPAYEMSESN
jgi:phosphate:Na+ symporter